MSERILILGGTGDARALAARLVADGHHVISSLAGVTAEPALPEGLVRTGGFGGVEGLVAYLEAEDISLIIDATHPFATRISANGAVAAETACVPILRLERPAWQAGDGDRWISARDTGDAIDRIDTGACAFVTIGRKEIGAFARRRDIRVVARMIEPPEPGLPDDWKIILARPSFSLEDEMALMRTEGVRVLVAKNAGGPARAKLDAARTLGLPVIMIERPLKPAVKTVATVDEVAALAAGEGT